MGFKYIAFKKKLKDFFLKKKKKGEMSVSTLEIKRETKTNRRRKYKNK